MAACAVAPAEAVAARLDTAGAGVSAKPSLYPAFRSGVSDYVVRCRTGKRVRLSIYAPAGTRVGVGASSPRSGHFTSKVRLSPGVAVGLRFVSSSSKRTYHVRCLPSDFPNWKARRTGTTQAAWYVLTPNDNRPVPGYVAIFDSNGVPVWWMHRSRAPFDAHLLADGNVAWNRWVGNSPVAGPYEEHALDGGLVHSWSTVHTVTNQHDLQFLPNGNALLIAYPPRGGVDLSRWGGPSHARVVDGEIQEVDPHGNLVWSWNSKDHIAISETGRWLHTLLFDERPVPLGDGRRAYDIVHLNSVEPVGDKLVLSTRYDDAVYEIDKTSGDVVWKLGGRHTSKSLKIVGDRLASKDFGGQHDARVADGGKVVTVYDNGTRRKRPPRALEFHIDLKAHTAKLVRTIAFSPAADSICCGSARLLPGGNWVVAWGHTRWVTEQTRRGRPVFTLRFAARYVMSYRAEPVLPGRVARVALRRGMDAMAAP